MKMSMAGACLASWALAGCATIPADRGRNVSEALLKTHSTIAAGLQAGDAKSLTDELLAQALDADAAVRVALLNNPKLQRLYADLGLAQAEVYDAGRLSNPTLGYAQLRADGEVVKTAWSISQRFTELLFLRFNSRVARSELLQTQQRVADEVLTLEAEVRGAYYRHVGAQSISRMRERVAATAAAAAQFAQQLHEAGNISALQLSREQAAASEARVQRYRAGAEAQSARGELLNLLGLPTTTEARFVERLELPTTPAAEIETDDLQAWALEQRLDLIATQEALRATQMAWTHARRWRWLGGVELGAEREREEGRTATGPSASLELPLFNQGGGSVLRAQAKTEALKAEIAALELSIRHDIAVRLANLKTALAIVEEYRQQLLPLRERIVELSQQEQNFMLIGAFELLSSKQEELDTYQSYLEAVSEYWIAQAELARAAGGRLPETPARSEISVGVDALPAESENVSGEMDHGGHATQADDHSHAGEHHE